ncbi:hypothetical protein LCGC14_3074410 [marine sediment metagenome]|uniref:Uncharacterized protein n=1 Tax=marine sediment metagenome TaxID=412755 RepID=A0A0F8WF58_9ZZZZ
MIDGMDLAQAAHDTAEPPAETECRFCDGQGMVTVVWVADCSGRNYGFKFDTENPSVPCPICKLGMTLNGDRLE